MARKVWSVSEENDAKAALMGIEATENFFRSIGMTVSLKELGVDPSEEDLEALSLDATMQGTLKLSRIRPLGEEDVNRIYTNAIG